MASSSKLPIDGFKLNEVGYGRGQTNEALFISGSGSLTAEPEIAANTVDDGTILKVVKAKTYTFSCEMHGDQTALRTESPDQDHFIPTIEAKTGTAVDGPELYGVLEVNYDDSTHRSSLSFRGKEKVAPETLLTAAVIAETTAGDIEDA
jgi:hypothetical protein